MQDSVAFFCACAAARESETLKRSSERGPPAAIWPFVQKKEEKPQKRKLNFRIRRMAPARIISAAVLTQFGNCGVIKFN
jgi:hypothetical protein